MNDRNAGKGKQIIGAAKQRVGRATGDQHLVEEGQADSAEGTVQRGVGEVKEVAKAIKKKVS
jgi:uncharacterized protein YjbJ (UPF0337 family)